MHRHIWYEFQHQFESFQIFKSPLLIIISSSGAWFAIKYLPSPMLLFFLVSATLVDLLTGLLKAWSKNICSSSIGFRRTLIKIGSYSATVVLVVLLANIIGVIDVENKYDLSLVVNGLISFMTFIEIFSSFENISLAYPNSPMTQYFIKPIMKVLKGRITDNPISKFAKKSEN